MGAVTRLYVAGVTKLVGSRTPLEQPGDIGPRVRIIACTVHPIQATNSHCLWESVEYVVVASQ